MLKAIGETIPDSKNSLIGILKYNMTLEGTYIIKIIGLA